MPLIDMPLEKLKQYTGRNPRPDDFEEYWDESLQEMRAVQADLELRPGGLETRFAECYDLFFTGVEDGRIHAKYLLPSHAEKPGPAVVFFHGYGGRAPDWSDLLVYAAQGFTVAALDCRGQGGQSTDFGGVRGNTLNGHIVRGLDDEPRRLLYRSIFLDCAQLAGLVMDMDHVDATRVAATGGSQGGGLTLACAALEPRIARAAPIFPFLCDYLRVWEMDLAKGAYHELQEYFRKFDPRHETQDEVFRRLGYIDVQHLAPRIKANVMLTVGLMDTICPPSTQFAAYNKIQADKSLQIYPDFGHEGLPDIKDLIFQFLADL